MLPRGAADASLVVDLARIVGAHGVSTLDADRFAYSRDCWPRDLMRVRAGDVPCAPSCVVWPETPAEVARVLALASDRGVPVVPFGAGSGVMGGVRPVHGGITLDLKRMRAIRRLDEKDLRAEVEVGVIGERLERTLNQRGYTLGHFPSSIVCSTLGGWLAARSAGQMSTLYGKIEDMTFGLEVATPGVVRRIMLGPRPRHGPDFNPLIIGSEGTFAAITAAELRIRPLPESRKLRGWQFKSVEAGLEAIRRMLRAGLRPAVTRLYDAIDTFIGRGHGSGADDQADGDAESAEMKSLDVLSERARGLFEEIVRRVPGLSPDLPARLGGRVASTIVRGTVRAVLGAPIFVNRAAEALPGDCLLILGFEGQPALVAAEDSAAARVCEAEGGTDLGPGPGEQWLKNRYNVSFKQSKAYANGVFTDTMEVAATWDRLHPMYRAVRKAIARDAFVMAHFSHAYPEGCSIYFTFAGAAPDPGDPSTAIERYDRLWRNALAAVSETGGTISHHHGIGELKAQAMAREHGPGGMRLLHALKHAFDPRDVMNPGKLGIEEKARPARLPRPRKGPHSGHLPPEIAAAVGERNLIRAGGRILIRPPDESGLASVLRIANARDIPIFSDQTGYRPRLGAMQVDLRRFDGVIRLSSHSLFVETEAGVRVDRLEALLGRHGLTLGPVHRRAESRTVGAALARNLLIRRGTAFGDLRDLCFAVRGLLANGAPIETRPVPRSATGPELDRALIGCGGRWGLITSATLRVAVVPPLVRTRAYVFATMRDAIGCARRVLRRGVRPAAAKITGDLIAAFDLVAHEENVLDAQLAIVASAADRRSGRPTEVPPGFCADGRFDAVVEIASLWTRAADTFASVRNATGAEVWIDFLAPEAVTVVARVPDSVSRRGVIEAGRAAGGRIVSGGRTTEPIDESERVELQVAEAKKAPVISESEHIHWAPYADVAERVADALDPTGIFGSR